MLKKKNRIINFQDSSGHSLSEDFWKDSDALKNFGNPRQQEWEINQDISNEEISEVISSTLNFKACDSDGIPMEFFKTLIPGTNDSYFIWLYIS